MAPKINQKTIKRLDSARDKNCYSVGLVETNGKLKTAHNRWVEKQGEIILRRLLSESHQLIQLREALADFAFDSGLSKDGLFKYSLIQLKVTSKRDQKGWLSWLASEQCGQKYQNMIIIGVCLDYSDGGYVFFGQDAYLKRQTCFCPAFFKGGEFLAQVKICAARGGFYCLRSAMLQVGRDQKFTELTIRFQFEDRLLLGEMTKHFLVSYNGVGEFEPVDYLLGGYRIQEKVARRHERKGFVADTKQYHERDDIDFFIFHVRKEGQICLCGSFVVPATELIKRGYVQSYQSTKGGKQKVTLHDKHSETICGWTSSYFVDWQADGHQQKFIQLLQPAQSK